jgi:hypothetical protein
MLTVDEVTEIFYLSDEFSKAFMMTFKKHLLSDGTVKKQRNRPNRLSDSEVMTIPIAFHLSGMRNLKHFYLFYVCKHMVKEFLCPVFHTTVSLSCSKRQFCPRWVFLKTCRTGFCTGISFIDSTFLKVCHIKREHQHRVFEGIAFKGKGTPGRFFGFKLHIVINDKGEISKYRY